MLDRCKVLYELQKLSEKLFFDAAPSLNAAYQIWEIACADPTFNERVKMATVSLPLSWWQGRLNQAYQVDSNKNTVYTIVGIDGSQIYPDKHQGSACFLVNIGTVVLRYGAVGSVEFMSEPTVFASEHEESFHGSPIDIVNCRRQELEFTKGLAIMDQLCSAGINAYGPLLLFDGSLVFWHLESKEQDLRLHFLTCYCQSLLEFYTKQHLCAGYISLPKNKDLVNLLRFAHQEYLGQEACADLFEHVVDTHICAFFLKPYSRSNVFMHQSKLCQSYPEQVRPYFFYLHVGSEIVRIELPAWIALCPRLTDYVATLILDNALKGQGYPVALAEAHEQAVVKGPDRDFFYQLIQKVGFDNNRSVALSQKVLKKRGISI